MKLGYKGGIISGLLLVAIGGFWFIPATHIASFWAFLLGVCVIASGLTFLETIANPYTIVLGDQRYAATRITLAQSCNGIGWLSVACVFLSYFLHVDHVPYYIFPGIFGLGIRAKKASAYIVMAIMGGAFLPKLMGYIADRTDISRGFIVPVFCFAFVAFYAFKWPRLSNAGGIVPGFHDCGALKVPAKRRLVCRDGSAIQPVQSMRQKPVGTSTPFWSFAAIREASISPCSNPRSSGVCDLPLGNSKQARKDLCHNYRLLPVARMAF